MSGRPQIDAYRPGPVRLARTLLQRWGGVTLLIVAVWLAMGPLRQLLAATPDEPGPNLAAPAPGNAPAPEPVLTEAGLPGLPGEVEAIDFAVHARPVLEWYCMDCHGGGITKGGVDLSGFADEASVVRSFKHWEKIVEQIESRTMPPMDADQPDEPTRQQLAAYLRHVLDSYDGGGVVDPGPSTLRRLTHAEYDNTVRDLTGVDLRPATGAGGGFPSDAGGGEGFTNNAQTLFVSPLLMEKYLDAAQQIVEHAEVSFTRGLVFHEEVVGERTRQAYIDAAELAAREQLSRWYEHAGVYVDDTELIGPYARAVFRFDHAKLSRGDLTLAAFAREQGLRPAWLEATRRALTGGNERFTQMWQAVPLPTADTPVDEQMQPLEPVIQRMQELIAKEDPDVRREFCDAATKRAAIEQSSRRGLDRFVFGLSFGELWETLDETERHLWQQMERELRQRQDAGVQAQRELAGPLIADFAMRAYRRPLGDEEVDGLMAFYDGVAASSPTVEEAVRQTLRRVLVSPHFLFRVERPIAGDQAGAVSDYELASRLSYLVWASMPDEALFAAAGRGELRDPAELERQVRWMLADEKAAGLAEQFVAQWLGLSELERHQGPDHDAFPTYDEPLGEAMYAEAVLFFTALIREDRPIEALIAADFTFVNPALAKVYGLDGIEFDRDEQGQPIDRFVRVDTAGTGRGGVLGMAGVHLMTSYPHRASPVLRGQWVLGAILGSSTPPPPPDVGELPEGGELEGLSLRERLQEHRNNPTCAVCHDRLDPIGFALQGYDAIGRRIVEDAHGNPIDDRATTPDGAEFAGPDGLRDYLLGQRPKLYRQAAMKALGYALGREVEYYDRPAMRRIEAALAQDPRFSTLMVEVARSYAFSHRRGEAQDAAEASGD